MAVAFNHNGSLTDPHLRFNRQISSACTLYAGCPYISTGSSNCRKLNAPIMRFFLHQYSKPAHSGTDCLYMRFFLCQFLTPNNHIITIRIPILSAILQTYLDILNLSLLLRRLVLGVEPSLTTQAYCIYLGGTLRSTKRLE